MGLAKQAMMEYEEQDWEETYVSFKCPECGEFSDGTAEVPKVLETHEYELNVDMYVDCIFCGESFQAEFLKTAEGSKIKFDEHPDTSVDFEPVYFEEYDEWYDDPFYDDRPENPDFNFRDASRELKNAIGMHGTQDGKFYMNRMFFSQAFSIFETYLSDTFLNLVFLDKTNKKILVQKHEAARDLKISLFTLMDLEELKASEIVDKQIVSLIKKISFHNLRRINKLYKIYNIDLFPNKDIKNFLIESLDYRHHSVHRNGFDLEGNRLDIYTKDYVIAVMDAMNKVTSHVNSKIEEIQNDKFPL